MRREKSSKLGTSLIFVSNPLASSGWKKGSPLEALNEILPAEDSRNRPVGNVAKLLRDVLVVPIGFLDSDLISAILTSAS
jgi:hypothetical protein